MRCGQVRKERHEVYASAVAAFVEDEERMRARAHIVREESAGLINHGHGDVVAADFAKHVRATFSSQVANGVYDSLPVEVEGKEILR